MSLKHCLHVYNKYEREILLRQFARVAPFNKYFCRVNKKLSEIQKLDLTTNESKWADLSRSYELIIFIDHMEIMITWKSIKPLSEYFRYQSLYSKVLSAIWTGKHHPVKLRKNKFVIFWKAIYVHLFTIRLFKSNKND